MLTWLFLFPALISSLDIHGYMLLCDVGSTGTRFLLYEKYSSSYPESIHVEHHGEIPIGLHTLSSSEIYPHLRPTLLKIQNQIAEKAWRYTDVYLLGTGGMRTLSSPSQKEKYTIFLEMAIMDVEFKLNVMKKALRTLSGAEEAFFAALAVNYLKRSITSALLPSDTALFGTLDLGGSTTEIAFDVGQRIKKRYVGKNARRRIKRPLGRDDFFAHGFKEYGVNAMKERMEMHLMQHNENNDAKDLLNPCAFSGDDVTMRNSSTRLKGTGNAKECIDLVADMILTDNAKCGNDRFCALASFEMPKLEGRFYAFSTFYYAVAFANDVLLHAHAHDLWPKDVEPIPTLKMPTPNVAELEAAANVLCGYDLTTLLEPVGEKDIISVSTPVEKLPRRCFDLCYTITLLKAYGLEDDISRVTFADTIGNMEISWNLGAHLHIMTSDRAEATRIRNSKLQDIYTADLPFAWMMTLLVFVAALLFLHVETKRTQNRKYLKSFTFLNDSSE